MKNYWNTLNERERWMVLVAGVCLFFYLLYIMIFSPLSSAITAKTQRLASKKETLTWLQKAKQQNKRQKRQAVSNSQLLTVIARQLKDSKFQGFAHQLEQTAAGDIQLTFNEVPLKTFLTWLENLDTQYAVEIKQMHIEGTERSGLVKIDVTLTAQ